jgi:hypothetical protein
VIPKEEQLTVKQAGDLSGYSAASITRWIEDGAKLRGGGRLRLRAERHPAGWRTTGQWVSEFIAELTRHRTGQYPASDPMKERTRAASAELTARGW